MPRIDRRFPILVDAISRSVSTQLITSPGSSIEYRERLRRDFIWQLATSKMPLLIQVIKQPGGKKRSEEAWADTYFSYLSVLEYHYDPGWRRCVGVTVRRQPDYLPCGYGVQQLSYNLRVLGSAVLARVADQIRLHENSSVVTWRTKSTGP